MSTSVSNFAVSIYLQAARASFNQVSPRFGRGTWREALSQPQTDPSTRL